MKAILSRFIRHVILESNNSLESGSLKRDIKTVRDAAAAIKTFNVVQSYVKGAKSLGQFLENLPIGTKVWQWQETATMKDGVFVIKDIDLSSRPKSLIMILQKGDDGAWTSPTYFKMPMGEWGVQHLQTLVGSFVKPESISKFERSIRTLSLPIQIRPGDMSQSYIGSILITPATHIPDWVQNPGADTLMLLRAVDVPTFVDSIKNNSFMRNNSASMMFGVSIPDPNLGDEGIVPINMQALQQYDEQGAVTLEVHDHGSVYEVDVMKDPKTGRPVAYPRIPL